MAPILLWLVMILCLLISLVKYIMGIILKFAFPSTKVRKDYSYQPTVSVLMPCFNEGKTVYETIESISKGNYPNEKFEVIAQDDCSVDDSYEWILKAQRDFSNISIRTGRNEINSGKARTVCNALQLSAADIIISIDSDCIFHPNAIQELTACFSEPRIGSVGGRVGVRNPNDNVITAIQAVIYYSAFQLYKIPENWTRSVCCISGKAQTEYSALWSKQQLRWRRSIVRDFFYTLRALPQHVWKLHPNTVFTLVLTPLGALVGFLVVVTMLTSDPLAWAGPLPLVTALGIGAVLTWVIRRFSAKEALAHPLSFGAYVGWSIVSSLFLTPLALCTMDSADWGTRTKQEPKVNLGNTNS